MSKKILIIFTLALCFLTLSRINAQSFLNSGEIPNDLEIMLERTGCFGSCPDYQLTINNTGIVSFRGGRFTKIKGTRRGKVTPLQLKKIITEFEKANFFTLQNTYRSPNDGCKSFMTDMPSETLSIRLNNQSKEVSYYLGCHGIEGNVLENLGNLAKVIDKTTNSQRWVGK